MKKIIFLNNEKGNEICFNISEIPLNNRTIINRCKDYFGDEDPCIIHKNYISKKMIIEIDEILSKKGIQKGFCYELTNNKLQIYVDISEEYRFFKIVEE